MIKKPQLALITNIFAKAIEEEEEELVKNSNTHTICSC